MPKSTQQNDFKNYDLDHKETIDWLPHGLGLMAHTTRGCYRIAGNKLYFLGVGRAAEEFVGSFADPKKSARRHFNDQI